MRAKNVTDKNDRRRKEIFDRLFEEPYKTLDPIFLEKIWKPDIYIGKYILEHNQKVCDVTIYVFNIRKCSGDKTTYFDQ